MFFLPSFFEKWNQVNLNWNLLKREVKIIEEARELTFLWKIDRKFKIKLLESKIH